LALSFLALLLVYILISVLLFVVGIRIRSTSGSAFNRIREFGAQVASTTKASDLRTLLSNFANENSLRVEAKYSDGRTETFGPAPPPRPPRDMGPPPPWQLIWQDGTGLQVAIRVYNARGRKPPLDPETHMLSTGFVAAIFAVLLAFFFSKAISKPLADLAEAIERVEGTNLEAEVPVNGPLEVQELASSFNRMSKRLATSMNELRAEKEKAEASEASRRQFLSDVSHNLRTPLTATIGWVDSLLDGHVIDQEKCLRQILRETFLASKTLERLLHLSRRKHAGPIMNRETIQLSDVVLEIAETLEETAKETNLTLDLQIEMRCTVVADRHHLRDILQILLENISEHAGQDRTATIRTKTEDGWVEITISDDGPGLPKAILDSPSSGPLVAQTGRVSLGLAIASRLVQAHRGEFKMRPGQDGTGTAISLTLPSE